MPAPSVLIAASPYEGELCRRALAETGLRIDLADGREGALQLIDAASPLVVVIATGAYHDDAQQLLADVHQTRPELPIFVLADREGEIPDEGVAARLGAARLFLRPIDVEALAAAIERLAVEAELANEVSEQLEAVSAAPAMSVAAVSPVAALELEATFDSEWEAAARSNRSLSPLSRVGTEVLGEGGSKDAVRSLAEVAPADAFDDDCTAPQPLLRADELELEGFTVQLLTEGAEQRPADSLREETPAAGDLAEVPTGESARLRESARAAAPYDDDIDLDALGADTLSEITAESFETTFDLRSEVRAAFSAASRELAAAPRSTPLPGFASPAGPGVPDQPESVAEGSLQERDIASLLGRLHAIGFTGKLRLVRVEGEKVIYLEAGTPVFATSTFAHDRLGDLLWREGKLTRSQHAQTRALELAPGRRTAASFVELGLLKSHEIFATLRRHVEELVYSCFGWDSGEYSLGHESAAAEDRLRLSLPAAALILEGVRRKFGLERLTELVGPPDVVVTPTDNFSRLLPDCCLSPPERVAADLLDGERSLGEVLTALVGLPGGPLSEVGLYSLVWGLVAVGAARLGRAAGGRLSIDGALGERTIDRDRLLAKRAQVSDGDYFQILGIDRDASPHEIRRAYDRLQYDFHGDRFPDAIRSELGEAIAEIQEVLEEAYRVLIDDRLRGAYRQNLS